MYCSLYLRSDLLKVYIYTGSNRFSLQKQLSTKLCYFSIILDIRHFYKFLGIFKFPGNHHQWLHHKLVWLYLTLTLSVSGSEGGSSFGGGGVGGGGVGSLGGSTGATGSGSAGFGSGDSSFFLPLPLPLALGLTSLGAAGFLVGEGTFLDLPLPVLKVNKSVSHFFWYH